MFRTTTLVRTVLVVTTLALLASCNVTSTPEGPNNSPAPRDRDVNALRFDLDGAVGLQLGEVTAANLTLGSQDVSSGLLKVMPSGAVEEALVEGNASVREFFVRGGNVYLLLERSYSEDGQVGCLLAQIDSDGFTTCIDEGIADIDIKTIQFDAAGNIYYLGYTSEWKPVIRSHINGRTTDFHRAQDAISIERFLVTRDGTVLISGQTHGVVGSSGWIRAIDSTGNTQTYNLSGNRPALLDFMPDGSVLAAAEYQELRRITLYDGVQLQPVWYAGYDHDWEPQPVRYEWPHQNLNSHHLSQAFSQGLSYRSADYMVTLTEFGLVRLFPTVELVSLPLKQIINGDMAFNTAVVAGLKEDGAPGTYLVNLVTDEVTELFTAHDVDVLRLKLNLDQDRLVVYGLDLSRNQPVIGEYDFRSGVAEFADVRVPLAASFDILDWSVGFAAPEPVEHLPEPAFVYEVHDDWEAGKVTFSAAGTPNMGLMQEFTWDLGDGTVANGVEVTHYYRTAGIFDVTLHATNDSGSTASVKQMVEVTDAVAFDDFQARNDAYMALTATGDLLSWGLNDSGLLGVGSAESVEFPTPVELSGRVQRIVLGERHVLAVTESGALYSWGANDYGQLGLGTSRSANTPQEVPGLSQVSQVSANFGASAAVTETGELYAWGFSSWSSVGDGRSPQLLAGGFTAADSVSLGYNHVLVLDTEGHVWAAGDNSDGQLGISDAVETPAAGEFVLLTGLPAVQSIWAIENRSYALTQQGDLYAWGENHGGHLGVSGNADIVPEPTLVPTTGMRIIAVQPGRETSFAMTDDGAVLAWGEGGSTWDRLFGPEAPIFAETPILLDYDLEFAGPPRSPAHRRMLGVGADGGIYAWGYFHELPFDLDNPYTLNRPKLLR